MEKTFLEVDYDNCEIKLLDGSKWSVNPGDLSIVSCWTPTAKVKIEPANNNRIYSYKITNLTDNSVALAAKLC